MWEYEVMLESNPCDKFFIWGYSFKDACSRNGFNPDEIKIIFYEYLE